ncbi:hypothetical protein AAG570_002332 [Ranatra chinensis]|uniref:Uncharacterized protein n=1 Tax=Ranatra chinensis TaxID=642074 RepID=A0ABD0Y787_9HEMI
MRRGLYCKVLEGKDWILSILDVLAELHGSIPYPGMTIMHSAFNPDQRFRRNLSGRLLEVDLEVFTREVGLPPGPRRSHLKREIFNFRADRPFLQYPFYIISAPFLVFFFFPGSPSRSFTRDNFRRPGGFRKAKGTGNEPLFNPQKGVGLLSKTTHVGKTGNFRLQQAALDVTYSPDSARVSTEAPKSLLFALVSGGVEVLGVRTLSIDGIVNVVYIFPPLLRGLPVSVDERHQDVDKGAAPVLRLSGGRPGTSLRTINARASGP